MQEIIIKGPNEKVYKHTLANGMTIYIWPSDLSEDISLSLTVKYGSIHTKFSVDKKLISVPNGMAHFLEHIKFNEKKGITAHDFFYKIGSYTNAYTTFDHTSYEVVCNKMLKENLQHLLYFVFNPYFTKELIEKEKPIIVEESKMVLDDPYSDGYFHLSSNIYHNSNRKYLITGKEKDINSITINDVLNVFNNFYVPSNMFLTVSGNIKAEDVINVCEEFFMDKDNTFKDIPLVKFKKEPDTVKLQKENVYLNVTTPKVLLAYKIPNTYFKDYSLLETRILLYLLLDTNFGPTSDFNEYLKVNDLKDSLTYSISSEENHTIVSFEISSKYPEKVCKLVRDKFNDMNISVSEFERKIKVRASASILGYEDSNDVNNQIRYEVMLYTNLVDDIISILKKLTLKDALNINKYIKNSNYAYIVLLEKKDI